MGRDKALLPFGNAPTLAAYQFQRLSPLFEATYLSVKHPSLYPKTLPLITDEAPSDTFAPTTGFVAAFRALDAKRIFVLSVDTPFVSVDTIARLIEADSGQADAVIARTQNGIHPLCGIYHRRLLPLFEKMALSGEHKLGKLLQTNRTVFVDFENESEFANLNHPHEYEAAVKTWSKK